MLAYFQYVDGCCRVKGGVLFYLYRHSTSVGFHCCKKSYFSTQRCFPVASMLVVYLRKIWNKHLKRSLGAANRYLYQGQYNGSCFWTRSHFVCLSQLYLCQLRPLLQTHFWWKRIYETLQFYVWEGSLKVTCSIFESHHIQLRADTATGLEGRGEIRNKCFVVVCFHLGRLFALFLGFGWLVFLQVRCLGHSNILQATWFSQDHS